MEVSREMFRTVRWLLVGLLAVQLLIVPWRWGGGRPSAFSELIGLPGPHATVVYRPIVSPPLRRDATIDVGRLLLQLAVTGGLLLLWLRVAKPQGVDAS